MKNKQVKGPGSPTGVPCRVTSSGRAGRSGIFPRRQFPHFPGSVWRPWGHGRGQKTRISRWQAIFPGVTAGVSERMKKSMAEKDLKRKFALWIRPSLLEEVDSLYESDNCASRSEFMEKALRFYIAFRRPLASISSGGDSMCALEKRCPRALPAPQRSVCPLPRGA